MVGLVEHVEHAMEEVATEAETTERAVSVAVVHLAKAAGLVEGLVVGAVVVGVLALDNMERVVAAWVVVALSYAMARPSAPPRSVKLPGEAGPVLGRDGSASGHAL